MSAILSADDLNDFISPGVACIKPVETLPKENDSNPYEVTTEDKIQTQKPAPASISLTDCLACSGCVTSAEAVLVSLQSHTEVLNTLDSHPSFDISSASREENGLPNGYPSSPPGAKVFIASVSPQVRASLAAAYGISTKQAGNLIEQFLSGSQGLRLGGQHKSHFTYVFDTNGMRDVCLVLGADEVANSLADTSRVHPVLTSVCPGWICYAEKTHPHILPHLSRLKSPQAMTGTLFKSVLSKTLNIHPSQIWHLAIMPCFDKKLEASREELTDRWWLPATEAESSASPVRDVDCVITSRELLSLADARGIQFSQLPLRPLSKEERIPFPDQKVAKFLYSKPRRHSGPQFEAGTSGGYLYHILKTEQARNPGSSISVQRGRNIDVVEYTLISSSNKPLLKCARYYGFRNIQNLVRKLKPPKQSKLPGAARRTAVNGAGGSDLAYVEVMACPGGCTNGGGQLRLDDVQDMLSAATGEKVVGINVQSQKELLRRVDEAYFSAESEEEGEDEDGDMEMINGGLDEEYGELVNGVSTKIVHEFLEHWAQVVSVPLDKLAYTSFRKVESDVGKKAKNLDDSKRIAAIVGLSGGGW
jgi:iron only hydrogenase large subunit-like protein